MPRSDNCRVSVDKSTLQARLYIACIIVLLAGLCGAALIYVTADEGADAASYVMIDGQAYPIDAGSSKAYVRDLRRFGGQAAVLFDEFTRWFSGLWRGKALAITVAWISIALSLGLFAYASYLPSGPKPDPRGKDHE